MDICDNCPLPNPSQADCQHNDIGDVCDLDEGTSDDCDSNGVPDECQPDADGDGVINACECVTGPRTGPDCNDNGIPDACEPEADCNHNNSLDECDIALGLSDDCDDDGVPDECSGIGDCNSNDILDSCDIAAGSSADVDANGIPDECQECFVLADCADLDGDGIRDDNCLWWACESGSCQPDPIGFADMGGSFGACPPDGAADGNDRFHALNCFSNLNTAGMPPYPCESSSPVAYNVDAGGPFGNCDPDGVCDGNDAFHALNAFQGSTMCSCPSGPAPTTPRPPIEVAETSIRLEAESPTIRPGETVEVHVFLVDSVLDLRGYQLHVTAAGGDSGTVDLVDIAVHDRKDRVFVGRADWRAFNIHTYQMLAGLDTEGVETRIGAYLATFTFRFSPDAAGAFTLGLLHDDQDPAQRTFLFPTPAGAKIEVKSVIPAMIRVKSPAPRRS
jgi:hypothetical protein